VPGAPDISHTLTLSLSYDLVTVPSNHETSKTITTNMTASWAHRILKYVAVVQHHGGPLEEAKGSVPRTRRITKSGVVRANASQRLAPLAFTACPLSLCRWYSCHTPLDSSLSLSSARFASTGPGKSQSQHRSTLSVRNGPRVARTAVKSCAIF
jgi:hypothetical protein